jgi:LytR cell envelope-related transcriptional attenuator/cell envelope-related transcriptional attenuator-like protein
MELLVTIAVVTGGVVYTAQLPRTEGQVVSQRPTPRKGSAVAAVALSVTDAGHALLAAITSGPRPSVIALPPGLTVVLPGQGEVRTDEVSSLTGPSVQVAISNVMGVWVDHYAVLNLDALGGVVDRAGGIRADLPDSVTIDGVDVGPGPTTLDGRGVVTLLAEEAPASLARWQAVLVALLDKRPSLLPTDLAEVDDSGDVQTIFQKAGKASVLKFPVESVAGAARVPGYEALDAILSRAWGSAAPTPVILQNGSGVPGVGEDAARLLIPEGFRIALSQNANTFNHKKTAIVAQGEDALPAAKRARRALGVGQVGVTDIPSGIGDITIVVGKDFRA